MNLSLIFDSVVHSLVLLIAKVGYFGIFIGMFLESTVFPLPSELVMIPAGIASAQGIMNPYIAVLCGVSGNLAGAIFSYILAASVGRAILFKIGKYFFLKAETIIKIETFFKKHGPISIFIGRIIPGLRHFIALPAGVARMNFGLFCCYTTLGSLVWTTVLTALGHLIGTNQDLIKEYLHITILGAVVFCSILILIYSLIKRRSPLSTVN